MLALSLHQPWASLLASGFKRVETRSWHPLRCPGKTPPCLPFIMAVHAARRWTTAQARVCDQPHFREALAQRQRSGWPDLRMMTPCTVPLGEVVGVVLVEAVYTTDDVRIDTTRATQERPVPFGGEGRDNLLISEAEEAFGDFRRGRYAWLVSQFHRFEVTASASGRQGFFDWTPPPGLVLPDFAASAR